MKAQQAYRDANSGIPPKIRNDIFKPSNPGGETNDELSIFSGKTHTLTAKSTSSAVATSSSSSTTTTASTPSSSSKSRSSSDSPQLVLPDNPSFKGVHPSLVSELNVFNGLIKRQLENAYKAGGEVFGGGEPMVVDGQGSGGGGGGGGQQQQQPTQMHAARQQQPQQAMYQPDYQRQHFDKQEAKRLEREREEAANREMERQEMEKHEVERQELARQQQLHQQREIQRQQQQELLRQQQQQAQQEIIQQQQQLDIRRQQEKQQQQQMQDQYRQQLEVPQHQLQQRQPSQYHLQRHSYDHDQSQMLTEPDHGMVTSSAHSAAPPMLTLSHSQSHPNIHQAYQQRSQHYQPMHHPDTAGVSSYAPPPPGQRVPQRAQPPSIRYSTVAQQPQQHSMYAIPPEYSSPDSMQTGVSYVPPPTSTYLPPTPISASSSPSSYIPQWTSSSYSFAMPDQQATSPSGGVSTAGPGSVYPWATTRKQTPEFQQHQQYTPEGALRGIAADDRSLQETWQSYMSKVYLIMA